MKADIYNLNEQFVNTIDNVTKVISCKDGRHLITAINKCPHCKQDISSTTQCPSGYIIEIKEE